MNRPTTKIPNIEDEHSFDRHHEEIKTPERKDSEEQPQEECRIEVDEDDIIHEKSPEFE